MPLQYLHFELIYIIFLVNDDFRPKMQQFSIRVCLSENFEIVIVVIIALY